ncbi:MAG: glycosyltransferase family 4 protein [Kiritimatiellales bacterium]|nr:glycosyltransferase family 4 protein [Kiritimatiellales bacterium]
MKILVYDENPDYGGHQIMACHGVAALAADPSIEVVCMINPANRQLAKKLGGFQIASSSKDLRIWDPDLVLCIQGDISQSTRGVLAAKKAGIECVSYIAIPHCLADMGAKFGSLRDRLNQHLLNQPDRYIAIAASMKALLIGRGVKKPIAVVHNGIAPPQSPKPKAQSLLTLGLLGRVEFNQKRQDFMVRTFCEFSEAFQGCRLIMAGNGPDEAKLRKLIKGKENITLLPWQENADAFYEQIDFLLIPSRFEGVPLVMLEALARGIPVLGSRRDGMLDILPREWTFEPENGTELAETFSRARNTWQTQIEAIQQKVSTEMTLAAFQANFRRAVVRS